MATTNCVRAMVANSSIINSFIKQLYHTLPTIVYVMMYDQLTLSWYECVLSHSHYSVCSNRGGHIILTGPTRYRLPRWRNEGRSHRTVWLPSKSRSIVREKILTFFIAIHYGKLCFKSMQVSSQKISFENQILDEITNTNINFFYNIYPLIKWYH